MAKSARIAVSTDPAGENLTRWLTVAAVCAAFLGCSSAFGASLVLHNTGVNSPNLPDGRNTTVLTTGGAVDQHYAITGPSGSASGKVIQDQSAYTANDGSSVFINFTGSGQSNQQGGHYLYTTSFEIPFDLNPATASLSGKFAADDGITNILLNGIAIPGFPTTEPGIVGFNTFTAFSIAMGANFVSGTNTLTFDVFNSGSANPTGLSVATLRGTAEPIPEPSIFGALLMGALLLSNTRARREAVTDSRPPWSFPVS